MLVVARGRGPAVCFFRERICKLIPSPLSGARETESKNHPTRSQTTTAYFFLFFLKKNAIIFVAFKLLQNAFITYIFISLL